MAKHKNKPPVWFYEQSAVIPFRRRRHDIEILLVTSIKRKRWIFPKGVVEPGMTARRSALKEAYEEAGIDGKITREAVGEYFYEKWNGTCRVQVFAMEVTDIHDEWQEDDQRKRRWVNIRQARDLIDRKELRQMLRRFEQNIDSIAF